MGDIHDRALQLLKGICEASGADPGTMVRHGDIAARLGLSRPATAAALNYLDALGLVRKSKDATIGDEGSYVTASGVKEIERRSVAGPVSR